LGHAHSEQLLCHIAVLPHSEFAFSGFYEEKKQLTSTWKIPLELWNL
jgi:hypothetical protein